MDSNKTPLNNNSNVPNRGFTSAGGPNSGSSNSGGQSSSGNRNNYNRKKKQQRHFGPSQPTNPSGQGSKPVNPSGDNTGAPHTPRPNNGSAQGTPGGNNPPRSKQAYPQNAANPQRHPNTSYPSNPQQPRKQQQSQRSYNSANTNTNVNGVPDGSTSHHQTQRNITPAGVPAQNSAVSSQAQRNDRPVRKWENRMVKIEETYEDIRKDNERIEKEIWLEIAEIHNAKLD